MKTIQETILNGYYHVDSPVTKEEWLEVLCDKTTPSNYIDALMKFYYEPQHESTCAHLGTLYSQPYASFNANIRSFGQFIQKKFDFNVLGEDGNPTYWGCVMDGKKKGNNFSWRVKSELAEAIKEFLYLYLFNKYKEHRKTVPIDDPKTTEKYKWELITECENKSLADIAYRIRTTNLVYTNLANGTIDWLYNNKHDEYESALQKLVGNGDLSQRLRICSKEIRSILKDNKDTKDYKFAADDERTFSTILACYDSNQYTFYMDKYYSQFCKFLGVGNEKEVTKKYPHFLELLQPLVKLIEKDDEIKSIVEPSIKGLKHSDLLLAQDICWEMFVKAPEELNYPPKKNETPRYWCVGYHIDDQSQLDSFFADNTWKGIFREKEDEKQLKEAKTLKKGDRLILKKSYTKGKNHSQSVLDVHAVGLVLGDAYTYDSNREEYVGLEVPVEYISREEKEFDAGKVGSYFNTIKETKDQELISYVESLMQRKMDRIDKYKKLLELSHNLILTGAPGTGKTYLAKELAAAVIGCEPKDVDKSDQFGFVQFHPSYDYTDFVEGLRPTASDDTNNVGFELRDGIFKTFCEKALKSSATSDGEKKNFVFVIDEINRGDMSKIFGELFFSIDPGYRGIKGKVTTQYANMQTSGNIFDRYLGTSDYGHFFVPSNVYIIGTMNDIDRSVESMDFAMRRRFAWKEVTAEESMDMLDSNAQLDGVRDEIKNRMRNLNAAIEKMEGLGKAYEIGAAYFMKYVDYGNFDDLWQYHLQGLLAEYLRGERDAEDKLEELHKAYNNAEKATQTVNDGNQR